MTKAQTEVRFQGGGGRVGGWGSPPPLLFLVCGHVPPQKRSLYLKDVRLRGVRVQSVRAKHGKAEWIQHEAGE